MTITESAGPSAPQAHACIDLETLSLRVDCVILSIGACSWLEGDPIGTFRSTFEEKVDMNQDGRRIDPKTVAWWAMQSDAARRNVFEGVANGASHPSLSDAIVLLVNWLETLKAPHVWTNDPSFDTAILNHANGGQPLWRHRRTRCARTAADCVSDAEYAAIKRALGTRSHTALDDSKQSGAVVQTYLAKTEAIRAAAQCG